ncbi:hypothetical protein E2986_08749 [Frieseomelitta varia]|uniref:Heparanase n=1 Tax=Frieseomelitta varia TaxID=561572 RepID=A0A833VPL1_9HYME|nr:hypothetical protein E2986_08749 [Frieseomelitta varia]
MAVEHLIARITIVESDWVLTHQWAEKAGLDVIACISPETRQKRFEESENAREIISFSDHMDFNANWQLGYECQIRCNLSAGDLGKQTVGLRKVLDEYPRYSSSVITGPDVVAYNSVKYQEYLRDYFGVAAPALSAVTWHPDFDSVTLGNGGAFVHQDNLEEEKEEMFKVIGRFIENKPLWIAESSPEECKSSFIGALVLTRRLGNAAKLNVNVFMRQPTDLTRPTPDYWVSLLHKTLVEREVFDARIQTGNENHVYLYCQCAKASNRHERGSIVIFGVNLSPEDIAINFEEAEITTVHEYILSPGLDAPNRMFAKTIFLNNKLLTLTNNTIPEIRPKILNDTKGVDFQLQSGDIGFWVVPDLKIKSCMRSDETSRAKPSHNYKNVANVKMRVKRSVREHRAAAMNEMMNRINDGSTFKSNVERELKRLKRFVRRKLDDYESRSLLNIRGLSDERTGDVSTQPEENMQNKLQEFKKRLARLRGLLTSSDTRIELRKPIADLVTDAISLMMKIQNTLKAIKKQTGQENRKRSSDSVRESLNTLYERLARGNLDEPIDNERRGTDRESKRTRRDLLAEIGGSTALERDSHLRRAAGYGRDRKSVELESNDSGGNTFRELFEANPVEDLSEDDAFYEHSPLNRDYDYVFVENSPWRRDRSKNDELKIRRKLSKMDYDAVNDRPWTGRENTYDYPFYERADLVESSTPWKDPTELNSKESSEAWEEQIYDHRGINGFVSGEEFDVAETESNESHKVDRDRWKELNDYHEPGDIGVRNHRPVHNPFIESDAPFVTGTYRSRNNDRLGNEKELKFVGTRPNEDHKVQDDNGGLRGANDYHESINLPKNHRPIYSPLIEPGASVLRYILTGQPSNERKNYYAKKKSPPDYYPSSMGKGPDFTIGSDYRGNKRSRRRDEDLHAMFDEEMINEDDANSRDCKCRMVRNSKSCSCRSKRDAVESLESLEFEVHQIPVAGQLSKDIVKSSIREDTDVEVFSEFNGHPFEKKLQTESSSPGINGESDVRESSEIKDSRLKPDLLVPQPLITDEAYETTFATLITLGDPYEKMESQTEPSEGVESSAIRSISSDPSIRQPLINDEREEAFATLTKRNRFEKAELEGSSKPKISRDTMSKSESLKSAETNLEDLNEDVLDRSDVEEFSVLAAASTPAENWELQDESSSNVEIVRNEKTPRSSQIETSVESNREIPSLQSRTDFETSSTSDLKARDESTFFLCGPDEKREEAAAINTAKYTAFNRESSTPAVVVGEEEGNAKEKGDAEEAAAPGAESSSTTVEAVSSLSEGTIGQESENNYDNGNVVGANSKREAKLREAQLPREKAELASLPAQTKRRLNVFKPRASKTVETLNALKDLFLKLKEETRGTTSAARRRSRINKQRNETRQMKELRRKLRDKRQMILQKFERGIRGMIDNTEQDPEWRKLKRREAWERIRDSEDFRDMIDREKLAYALMYQPAKYHSKREVDSSEEAEMMEVPEVTEIVRARNVRRRVFNPSDRGNFRDATIVEHPEPGKLRKKIIQLANLHRGEKPSRGKSESKGSNNKVYLAVVEDIERPRIFYYEEDPENEEENRDAQARSLYSSKYNRPLQKPYRESLKAVQYSEEEDQEESDELPEGREIYIIDPSEYKGGDPPMQLYGTPSKSRINLKKIINWKPSSSYKSYETRQPARRHDEIPDENSSDAIIEEIVRTIFDNVDSRVEKLFKKSARLDEEEDTDEREENEENYETSAQSSEKTDAQGVRYLRESDRDVSEEETQTEEDDVSVSLISRENATDANISVEDSKEEDAARVREQRDVGSKEYFTPVPIFMREISDVSRKSESINDLHPKQNSEKIPSGPKIEKARGHLETKKLYGKTLASMKKQIYLTSKSDESKKYENFPKNLRILSSLTSKSYDHFGEVGSVEYSSIEVNPIVGARDLYGKISKDCHGASDTVGIDPELDKSKKRSDDASYGDESVPNMQELRNEKEDKDNKEVDLKEAPFSDVPETMRVLPWIRKSNRLRREATNQETNENNKAEKVQPSELQHLDLDGSSSPRNLISSQIDDVEKSLIQKISLEKFSTSRRNANKRKNIKRNNDDGLSSLLQRSIPKLGNVVMNGLNKAENFTGSVERLIMNLDEKYNKTLKEEQRRDSTSTRSIGPTENVLHNAVANVKKIFILLSGITNLLQGNQQ